MKSELLDRRNKLIVRLQSPRMSSHNKTITRRQLDAVNKQLKDLKG